MTTFNLIAATESFKDSLPLTKYGVDFSVKFLASLPRPSQIGLDKNRLYPSNVSYQQITAPPVGKTLEENLFDNIASLKVWFSTVAMHMSASWRYKIFIQLDLLLDPEGWDDEDSLAQLKSFQTFVRLILHCRPELVPGLGLSSSGNIIAAWTNGEDRLTIECGVDDRILWSLVARSANDWESAAGSLRVSRLLPALEPFNPDRWFKRG